MIHDLSVGLGVECGFAICSDLSTGRVVKGTAHEIEFEDSVKDCEGKKLQVLGTFHTHPHEPAPSDTDIMYSIESEHELMCVSSEPEHRILCYIYDKTHPDFKAVKEGKMSVYDAIFNIVKEYCTWSTEPAREKSSKL
jgi:proteasome lid subunit RPN8/RPN11